MLSEYLEEVADLAKKLVDQVEGVDLLDAKPGDETFARLATPRLKEQKVRDELKRGIDITINKISGSELAQKLIDPEAVPCAARLVTWAIKRLIATMDSRNSWVMGRRLIIQFSSIEALWVEDGTPEHPQLVVGSAGGE